MSDLPPEGLSAWSFGRAANHFRMLCLVFRPGTIYVGGLWNARWLVECTVACGLYVAAWSFGRAAILLGLSAGYNLCMLLVECTVACRMCGGLWTVAAWSFGRAANHARLIEYATVIIVIVRHFFSHWLASSFVACGRGKWAKSSPIKKQKVKAVNIIFTGI